MTDAATIRLSPAPQPRTAFASGGRRKRKHAWKRWGPYLSERQWATVREDYSADGAELGVFPP